MNCDLEFNSPHVKAALHSHINFYRQLVQWWRIRKFFLHPDIRRSPAENWHSPAAGGHWTPAAASSLAAHEDNSVLPLCHRRVKLQRSAALCVLPERYRSRICEGKSIYSREMKTHDYEDGTMAMAAGSDGLCIKELLSEGNHPPINQSINQSINVFLNEKLNMNQLKQKFSFPAYLKVLQASVGVGVHLRVQLVAALEKLRILSSMII